MGTFERLGFRYFPSTSGLTGFGQLLSFEMLVSSPHGVCQGRVWHGSQCLSHQQGQEQGNCETLGQPQPQASVTSLETCGLSLEHPVARHGDSPCCGVAGAGPDSPGGLKCGPGLWQGRNNTKRGEQGQAGLTVCQGHGGVIFCTHLLCGARHCEHSLKEKVRSPTLSTQKGFHSSLPYY